jgi:hypothetical protein
MKIMSVAHATRAQVSHHADQEPVLDGMHACFELFDGA